MSFVDVSTLEHKYLKQGHHQDAKVIGDTKGLGQKVPQSSEWQTLFLSSFFSEICLLNKQTNKPGSVSIDKSFPYIFLKGIHHNNCES